MKILTFQQDGLRLGVLTEQGVLDVRKSSEKYMLEADIPVTIEQLMRGGNDAVHQLQRYVEQNSKQLAGDGELWLQEGDIQFGPCVSSSSKIICVGANYRKHAEESNMPIPSVPILFNKFANTIAAHGEDIPLPFNSEQVDYEAELGIVIGKAAKRVTPEEALDYVMGYCNVNDLSARELQFRTQQWLLGKCCDKFSPVGPYLVTADEVGNPNELTISCIVNGEVRQSSNTSDMIFSCSEIISYISQHMTLEPGDLILTGTPEGVVFNGFDGQTVHKKDHLDWLRDGDIVTIEIEKLGSLTNKMYKEEQKEVLWQCTFIKTSLC